MKKIVMFLALPFVFASCIATPPPPPVESNPGTGPQLSVEIPELFSPDPDIIDDTITIAINVTHSVEIKDWDIQIQPNRGQQGGSAAGNQQGARAAGNQQGGQAERRQNNQGRQGNRRRVFFEQTGKGAPPDAWQWNGKGTSGEMVQSASDYNFTLSVKDIYDNNSIYEGIINVDVLVRREGEKLRIIVPSIIFSPNLSDFSTLNQDEIRSNNRILRLITNALNRYPDYKVLVEGHSNPSTKPNTRERTAEEAGGAGFTGLKPLSEARAKTIVEQLVANGISRERLSSVGMGGSRTVADYTDAEENWKNRRVEFILER
jgi:outer membrane protein OmpA-like peptidoglycan-associated protein